MVSSKKLVRQGWPDWNPNHAGKILVPYRLPCKWYVLSWLDTVQASNNLKVVNLEMFCVVLDGGYEEIVRVERMWSFRDQKLLPETSYSFLKSVTIAHLLRALLPCVSFSCCHQIATRNKILLSRFEFEYPSVYPRGQIEPFLWRESIRSGWYFVAGESD